MTILRLTDADWCGARRAGGKAENLIRPGLIGGTTIKPDSNFSFTVPAKVGAHLKEKARHFKCRAFSLTVAELINLIVRVQLYFPQSRNNFLPQ